MATELLGSGKMIFQSEADLYRTTMRDVERSILSGLTVPRAEPKYRKLNISMGVNVATGTKPVVVCGSVIVEADSLDKAQEKAEELAHQHQTAAYILKPITKVSPKREVVTTSLE
jgi:hypothetical protein